MKDLASINKYLFKYKYYLLLGTFFIVIANIFSIVPAVLVRYSFNILQRNYEIFRLFAGVKLQEASYQLFASGILLVGVLILISALLRGVFLFFMRQTIIVMSRHIEYDQKNEIFTHYQTLPLSFYRRNNTGDLMNRISEDVGKVRMYLGPAIMYGINMFTLLLMVVPFMYSINPKLTLYSLLPLPILSLTIYFVNNIINQRSEEIQKSLSGLSSFVQEAFSGIRVIKAFARENAMSNFFNAESNEYKAKSLRLAFVDALFFPVIMALIGISIILTVYIGSLEVMSGNISMGVVAEFIIYVNMLTWPVTSLGWISSIIQQADASQRRINEFLNTKNDIISSEGDKSNIEGRLVFENVSFTYADSGIEALNRINFSISPGESLAVIGTTGSGKSTLANLICRMFDCSSGKIIIDGKNIENYDISHLRQHIGYVPQDVFLFSDSIKNNIAFGINTADFDIIQAAAKDADVLDNILGFPKGFETILGERGITLSGGQKQRVSIARAIARNPKILVLDDSLSAVDTHTENAILTALARIMKNRTSIIISHRVSSAKLADKIIVLDSGRVIEQGSHAELLNAGGLYKELYEKQVMPDEQIINE